MRRSRALPVLLVLALGLAACGGDDDDAGTGAPGTDIAGGITIDHRYGTTTLGAPPERILSLDNQWTDVLVALDAPLAAAALDPVVEGGRYPWQDGIPEAVEPIEIGRAHV